MEVIQAFDLFPLLPSLSINGRSSYSTWLSLSLSLLIVFTSFFLLGDTLTDWFYQINPGINFERRNNDKFHVNFGNMLDYSIMLQALYPSIPTLLSLKYDCPQSFEIRSTNSSAKFKEIKLFSVGDFCYLPFNYSLSKINYREENSTFVALKFNEDLFKNILEENSNNIVLVKLNSPTKVLNLNDPTSIFSNSNREDAIPLIETESRIYKIRLMRDSYLVQGSYFFYRSKQKLSNFYPIDSINYLGSIPRTRDLPYLTIIYEYSQLQSFTTIKYFDEQDIISAIGGMIGLMSTLGNIICSIWSGFSFDAFMLNKIYKFKGANPKVEKQLNNNSKCNGLSIVTLKKLNYINSLNSENAKVNTLDILRSNWKFCSQPKHKLIKRIISQMKSYYDYTNLAIQSAAIQRLFYLLFGNNNVYEIFKTQSLNIDKINLKLPTEGLQSSDKSCVMLYQNEMLVPHSLISNFNFIIAQDF